MASKAKTLVIILALTGLLMLFSGIAIHGAPLAPPEGDTPSDTGE